MGIGQRKGGLPQRGKKSGLVARAPLRAFQITVCECNDRARIRSCRRHNLEPRLFSGGLDRGRSHFFQYRDAMQAGKRILHNHADRGGDSSVRRRGSDGEIETRALHPEVYGRPCYTSARSWTPRRCDEAGCKCPKVMPRAEEWQLTTQHGRNMAQFETPNLAIC